MYINVFFCLINQYSLNVCDGVSVRVLLSHARPVYANSFDFPVKTKIRNINEL